MISSCLPLVATAYAYLPTIRGNGDTHLGPGSISSKAGKLAAPAWTLTTAIAAAAAAPVPSRAQEPAALLPSSSEGAAQTKKAVPVPQDPHGLMLHGLHAILASVSTQGS
jgi:hypothetical protein